MDEQAAADQARQLQFDWFRELNSERLVEWEGTEYRLGDTVRISPHWLEVVQKRQVWFPFPMNLEAVQKNRFKIAAFNSQTSGTIEILLEVFPILVWIEDIRLVGV